MNTRTKTTLAAGLAALAAGVGGVSLASAQDGATGSTGSSGATQQQDATPRADRPQRDGTHRRGDCPKDKAGGSARASPRTPRRRPAPRRRRRSSPGVGPAADASRAPTG